MRTFILLLFLPLTGVFAARDLDIYDQAELVESRMIGLEKEIIDLKSSVQSLDELHDKLSTQLLREEERFSSQMRRLIVPLLQWPQRSLSVSMSSWIELQRTNLILNDIRSRLVKEPIKLISDRELSIGQLKNVREELSTELEKLESKQDLMNLQLDEIKKLQEKTKQSTPQASARTKKLIGDIEGGR